MRSLFKNVYFVNRWSKDLLSKNSTKLKLHFGNNNLKYFCSQNKNEIKVLDDDQIKVEEKAIEVEVKYGNIKGITKGDSSHYIIQFTCKKCEHRMTRSFTKRAYHHGIVLIKCDGCPGIHLIADNLGWFEDSSVNVEEFLKRKGEECKKMTVEGLFQLSSGEYDSLNNKI
jgi:hypothetical protein